MSNENNEIIVEEQTINWVDVAKRTATVLLVAGIGYYFGVQKGRKTVFITEEL